MPHLVKVEEEGAHLDLSTVLHKGESEIKVDSNSEFMASWIGLAGAVPPIPLLMVEWTYPFRPPVGISPVI